MARVKIDRIAEGSRVAFAARFLRSIGDNSRGNARGTVVEVANLGAGLKIAYVHWDGMPRPVRDAEGNMPCGVITANLVETARLAAEACLADAIPQGGFSKLVKGL